MDDEEYDPKMKPKKQSTNWLGYVLMLFLHLYFWAFFMFTKPGLQVPLKGQNFLMVLAHPDDECMFFTPAINFLRQENEIHLLILSNGGYYGLGETRTKEMNAASDYQGFSSLKIVDDPNLQDGPDNTWDAKLISEYISQHSKGIDTIVTFDIGGVSHHPNHV